jgi:hypothetical protein
MTRRVSPLAAPLLGILGALLLWGAGEARCAAAAHSLPVPPLAPIERGEYRARDARTGEEIWRNQWSLERHTQDGNTIIEAREEGRGRRDSETPTSWIVRIEGGLFGTHRHLSYRREVRDASGGLLEIHERDLDFTGGTGHVTDHDPRTGRQESRRFPLPEPSVGAEMLAVELRLLPDADGHRMRFSLVTIPGKVLEMEARIVGREVVSVPAGNFDCYRIEVAPTGLLGVLADLLMPKIQMWHTVAAPHVWIKYQGPGEGGDSREILRELTRFEPPPK